MTDSSKWDIIHQLNHGHREGGCAKWTWFRRKNTNWQVKVLKVKPWCVCVVCVCVFLSQSVTESVTLTQWQALLGTMVSWWASDKRSCCLLVWELFGRNLEQFLKNFLFLGESLLIVTVTVSVCGIVHTRITAVQVFSWQAIIVDQLKMSFWKKRVKIVLLALGYFLYLFNSFYSCIEAF